MVFCLKFLDVQNLRKDALKNNTENVLHLKQILLFINTEYVKIVVKAYVDVS